MIYSTSQLYQLLPAIYRIRDAERGYPLRGLVAVIAQQAAVMEADIGRLYDNLFIETCDEWVVPYIGDLLGVRGLHRISDASFTQRARVANTLGYRRRKGTASMLEQLARDTTGWPARVVEFFQLLGATQYANHVRPMNVRTPDLRKSDALELLDGPFNSIAHTADVRHIDAGRGKHNIMNIGIFLWRLRAYPVSQAAAFNHGDGRFSFSPLGQDAPLFNHPVTETDPGQLAAEINVPSAIRRLSLAAHQERYYGENSSLCLWVRGAEVPRSHIVACNLSDWQYRPEPERIAVDPVLGRIAFSIGNEPEAVQVEYYYGFAGEVGGGGYERALSGTVRYSIGKLLALDTLQKALELWRADGRPDAIFEIEDSATYEESLQISIPAASSVEIRAAQQQRPVVRLTTALSILGAAPDRPGQPGGRLTLDGLLVTGQQLEVHAGDLESLQLRHCTLVPGWALTADGAPTDPEQPSLVALGSNQRLNVVLTRTISGRLVLPQIERLTLTDCLVDGIEGDALRAPRLHVQESTILGAVRAAVIEQASNSIFRDPVTADRKQEGCVRFCYLPLSSSVPRRYHCEPDTTVGRTMQQALEADPSLSPRVRGELREATANRLRPRFTHPSYGQPGYGQLHMDGPPEIRSGADDQAEMGVFHHLKQPQREANLRASMGEYLRVGLEAGLFYVT